MPCQHLLGESMHLLGDKRALLAAVTESYIAADAQANRILRNPGARRGLGGPPSAHGPRSGLVGWAPKVGWLVGHPLGPRSGLAGWAPAGPAISAIK